MKIENEVIKETKSSNTAGQQERQFDSDIFVMSNTTFDDAADPMSSRRASSRNEYKAYIEGQP